MLNLEGFIQLHTLGGPLEIEVHQSWSPEDTKFTLQEPGWGTNSITCVD